MIKRQVGFLGDRVDVAISVVPTYEGLTAMHLLWVELL